MMLIKGQFLKSPSNPSKIHATNQMPLENNETDFS